MTQGFATGLHPVLGMGAPFQASGVEDFIGFKIPHKFEAVKSFKCCDDYTSLALQFNTEFGLLNLYSTIVGTWFNRLPYAESELLNCVEDCLGIYRETKSVCLVGDLNTAFLPSDLRLEINAKTTNALKKLAKDCKMQMFTAKIEKNIDHIFLAERFVQNFNVSSGVFIEKDELSDHKGVCVEISQG